VLWGKEKKKKDEGGMASPQSLWASRVRRGCAAGLVACGRGSASGTPTGTGALWAAGLVAGGPGSCLFSLPGSGVLTPGSGERMSVSRGVRRMREGP
jgi:hypothetical protein